MIGSELKKPTYPFVYNESFSDSILYYVNKESVKDGLVLNIDYSVSYTHLDVYKRQVYGLK